MRLGRVLLRFWGTALSAELEYRSNFWVAGLASLGNLFGSGFSLWLFYDKGGGFPGWSFDEGLLVLGLFSMFVGLVQMLLMPNLSRIVQHVENGTLDFVLLKPLDSQLQVSLRVLSPWGLPDVVLGCGLIVVGGARAGVVPQNALLAILPLLSAAVILYSLWFVVATTSVWFVKIYNATEVLRGLLDAGRFPVQAYPPAYRFVFTFVVPITFLTTVPADVLRGRAQPALLAAGPILAAALLFCSRLFWRRALRSYTGASG